MTRRSTSLLITTLLASFLALPGCGSDPDYSTARLDPGLIWYGDNATRLEDMIIDRGVLGDDFNSEQRPVAVFDWDNTCIKNDIGDMTVFWMLSNNLVLQPPARDWSQVSSWFSAAALTALNTACDAQAEPGLPLTTDQTDQASRDCADAILSVYYDGVTPGGDDAYTMGDTETLEPAYALAVQLQAGYTPDEIRAFADDAIAFATAQPIGATQAVGNGEYNAYIRIYEQIADLMAVLQANEFDVWVVSASSQYLVEQFATQVGVDANHVIGVRATLDADGKAESTFQGCGTYADGNADIITFRQGKRCWINKQIFGLSDATAQLESASPIAFTAGDSPTDLWMLRDAESLRLVINRNKTELMCHAYENADGAWLINPMFIEPKAQNTAGYSCAAYGIADQDDTVY